jgi:hypothetical protein
MEENLHLGREVKKILKENYERRWIGRNRPVT